MTSPSAHYSTTRDQRARYSIHECNRRLDMLDEIRRMLCSSLDQRNALRIRLAELADEDCIAAVAPCRAAKRERLAPQAQADDGMASARAPALKRRASRPALGGRDAA